MDKPKQAVNTFDGGFNCAQSVLTPFLSELNTDAETVLKLSAGFGAGMGRLQGTCGAVTGAYMVLGLKYGKQVPDDESKEKVIDLIREFTRKFEDEHKFTSCRELLNADINTIEGQHFIEENNLHENVCSKCVRNAVQIIVEIGD